MAYRAEEHSHTAAWGTHGPLGCSPPDHNPHIGPVNTHNINKTYYRCIFVPARESLQFATGMCSFGFVSLNTKQRKEQQKSRL